MKPKKQWKEENPETWGKMDTSMQIRKLQQNIYFEQDDLRKEELQQRLKELQRLRTQMDIQKPASP